MDGRGDRDPSKPGGFRHDRDRDAAHGQGAASAQQRTFSASWRTGRAELSHAEERWRVLLQVNNALVTCLDRETLFEAIAGALRGVIPFDRAALVLDDPIEGGFKVLRHRRPRAARLRPFPSRRSGRDTEAGCGWIAENGLPAADPGSERGSAIPRARPADSGGDSLRPLGAPESEGQGHRHAERRKPGGRAVRRERTPSSCSRSRTRSFSPSRTCSRTKRSPRSRAGSSRRISTCRRNARAEAPFADVVGESAAIRKVLASVRMVAGTDSTVLVTGETGTGKELVVRAIHGLSGRKNKILVKVNCAALPSGVIESELFGHEKGAFTGALTRRVGRFELANGGTLFLDEVGDLPLELQAKLLRVLQEGEFERVGGTQTLKVNVRLVAATNRDLASAVEEGRFRADLFYRLNVFPIAIPPLRERVEDVPRLVRHFVMIYASKMGKSDRDDQRAGHEQAHGVSLARKRPGAAERHRARGHPRNERPARAGRPPRSARRRTRERKRPRPSRRSSGITSCRFSRAWAGASAASEGPRASSGSSGPRSKRA